MNVVLENAIVEWFDPNWKETDHSTDEWNDYLWGRFDNPTEELGITPSEADDYCREMQIESDLYDFHGDHTVEERDEMRADLVRRCHCEENARALREWNARSIRSKRVWFQKHRNRKWNARSRRSIWVWCQQYRGQKWPFPVTRETVECLHCIKQRLGHTL